jgi:D-3-phosphoglycerate dehydrogenase
MMVESLLLLLLLILAALGGGGCLVASTLINQKALLVDPAGPPDCWHATLESKGCKVDIRHGVQDSELALLLPLYDACIIRSANHIGKAALQSVREKKGRLRVIGRAGVGVDNIDVEAAAACSIAVVNGPTGSSESVAELAMGLLLAISRQIKGGTNAIASGRFDKGEFSRGAFNLRGKVLGICGMGRIGGRMAEMGRAMGMRVVTVRRPSSFTAESVETMDELLAMSDVVSLHLPLNPKTRGLIGARELSMLKPSAILLNTARGGLVDEVALLDALEQGRLAGSGLDVLCREETPVDEVATKLALHPRVVITPHLGASTAEAQASVLRETLNAVAAALEQSEPSTSPAKQVGNAAPVHLVVSTTVPVEHQKRWKDLARELSRESLKEMGCQSYTFVKVCLCVLLCSTSPHFI